MRRFLRYVLYREVYRLIRQSLQSNSNDSRPVEPHKAIEEGRFDPLEDDTLPAPGETIDSPDQLKAALQQMDAYDFEHFVADLWDRMGWTTEVSAESADQGVDVIARKQTPYPQTTLIQAKRYGPNTTVGSPEVQQYASLKNQYSGVDKVAIVTTNEFTGQAEELADRLNVKLVNGDVLVQLIGATSALDLVASYLSFIEAVPTESQTESPDEMMDGTTDGTTEPRPESISSGWQGAILAAIIGWIVIFLGVESLGDTMLGFLVVFSWVLLPIALYFDGRAMRNATEWPTYLWAYILTSLVWFIAVIPGIVYLWKRRRLTLEHSTSPSPAIREHTDPRTEPTNANNTIKSSSPESTVAEESTRTVAYEDKQYACTVSYAPNEPWIVAIGTSADPPEGRAFVYNESRLMHSVPVETPEQADIADTGTTLLCDGLDPDAPSGKLVVLDATGSQIFQHYFNGPIADCAITPDGTTAAVSTFPPDESVTIIDLDAGTVQATHPIESAQTHQLTFEKDSSRWQLTIRSDTDCDPVYVLTLDGTVQQGQQDSNTEPTGRSSLSDRLQTLRAQYETVTTEPERNQIAESLADTHLELAEQSTSATDRLAHLEVARNRYFELLPWYEGISGVASVLRREGETYLDLGDMDAAANCVDQLESLETEYGVEVVTAEDIDTFEAVLEDR